TREKEEKNSTKEVWVYDLRTNMPSFGKKNPLKKEHFDNFIKAYTAENREDVKDERWSKFSREEIREKGENLDIGLIKDDSILEYEDLPDPIESAEDAVSKLQEATELLMDVIKEL
ncbi:N-6 DNA methylase, partial [Clostridium haemolyticum]